MEINILTTFEDCTVTFDKVEGEESDALHIVIIFDDEIIYEIDFRTYHPK